MAVQVTFGRDGAMFEGLLGFVAQLSLVLWALVVVTVVIRFVGMWVYRRGAVPSSAAGNDLAPLAAAGSVGVPHRTPGDRRVEAGSAAPVSAFDAPPTEA